MNFDILHKVFPKGPPDASDFFSHDPLHGFTVSIVLGLTGLSNYVDAYNKFVKEYWPAVKKVEEKVVETKPVSTEPSKPVVSLKK